MRFPPEFIERLKNHLPISEVIGRRVPIKRHGREFQGLCPFHKEKSPSFTVNDEKGFFHCFGCGAHGDAIGFIKDFERVEYREAIERLAGEAGLELPKMTREAEEAERKRHTLEDVLVLAQRWFTEQLYAPVGKEAREYLRMRGLKRSTCEQFALGFAPGARDGLKAALMQQGATEAMLIEAGLLARPDEGATYDRFRARLIFPIRSAQGKTIAFGGRILPQIHPTNAAKYLNSPETPLFHKGEVLFAYDIARRNARDTDPLIVAEGYMDVIALHQAGFTTAVAPLGTAITEAQLKLLWRTTAEPVLCLDGDAAGSRAMLRAAELALPLLKAGTGLKFALLPPGEDPDSLLHKVGVAAMRASFEAAHALSHVLWEQGLARFPGSNPETRAALEQHLMQTADRIADPLVRQHMRSYFRDRMFSLKTLKKGGKPMQTQALPAALPEATDDLSHLKKLEEQLILLILLHPEFLHHSDIEEQFGHMDFTQPALDKLRHDILEINGYQEVINSTVLREQLSGRGHDQTVGTVLQNASRSLPKQTYLKWEAQPQTALSAWVKTCDAYAEKIVEHEITLLSRDDSEEAYQKIAALNKQKEQRQRNRYSVTPDEQAS